MICGEIGVHLKGQPTNHNSRRHISIWLSLNSIIYSVVAVLDTIRFILSILALFLSNLAIHLDNMQATLPPNTQGVE
jgi:hypothetical protein